MVVRLHGETPSTAAADARRDPEARPAVDGARRARHAAPRAGQYAACSPPNRPVPYGVPLASGECMRHALTLALVPLALTSAAPAPPHKRSPRSPRRGRRRRIRRACAASSWRSDEHRLCRRPRSRAQSRASAPMAGALSHAGSTVRSGLAFDGQGRVLVAEERGGRVVRLDPTGPRPSRGDQAAALARGERARNRLRLRPPPDARRGPRARRRIGRARDDPLAERRRRADGVRRRLRPLAGLFDPSRHLVRGDDRIARCSPTRRRRIRIPVLADGRAGRPPISARAMPSSALVGLALDQLGALFAARRDADLDGSGPRQNIVKLHPDGSVTLFASALVTPGVWPSIATVILRGRWRLRSRAPVRGTASAGPDRSTLYEADQPRSERNDGAAGPHRRLRQRRRDAGDRRVVRVRQLRRDDRAGAERVELGRGRGDGRPGQRTDVAGHPGAIRSRHARASAGTTGSRRRRLRAGTVGSGRTPLMPAARWRRSAPGRRRANAEHEHRPAAAVARCRRDRELVDYRRCRRDSDGGPRPSLTALAPARPPNASSSSTTGLPETEIIAGPSGSTRSSQAPLSHSRAATT